MVDFAARSRPSDRPSNRGRPAFEHMGRWRDRRDPGRQGAMVLVQFHLKKTDMDKEYTLFHSQRHRTL